MLKLAMVAAVCLLSMPSWAQTRSQMTVYCGTADSLLQSLKEDYEEKPYWFGMSVDKQSVFVLMTNDDNNAWTFVRIDNSDACVLAVGDRGKLLRQERK